LSIYSPFTRVDSFVFKTFGYFNWWLMHWRTIVCFNLSRLHLAQMQSFSFVKNFLIQQSVHWKLKYSTVSSRNNIAQYPYFNLIDSSNWIAFHSFKSKEYKKDDSW
jgi:hypothetical protein